MKVKSEGALKRKSDFIKAVEAGIKAALLLNSKKVVTLGANDRV